MAIFPLAPDQTIAQMWSNGARDYNVYWTAADKCHIWTKYLQSTCV